MMLLLLLSRILGLVRDSVMTAQFGRGDVTDAYILAFQIPDLLFFLIAGGALSSSFIPVFSEYLHTNREREAWEIFSAVVTLMSAGLLIAIGITYWQTDNITAHMFSSEKQHIFPLIAQMSRILLPAQYAFFIGGLLFGTLYARQRFAVPGLGPNVYNLGIIIGALVLSRFFNPGILGMAWGAVAGAVLGNLVIPLLVMRNLGGAQFKVRFDTKHPGVKKVFKLMLPVVLGLSLPGVYAMIMRSFGSQYPEGVVTSLDLSNKLMQAPLGIFGQSLAIGIFPALSQFFAQKRMDLFRLQMVKTCRTALYISIPISVVLAVFASDVVAILYQRGRFSAADGATVVECLVLFCIGIPAWCLHPIVMRGFFSMQNTVEPILIGTGTTVIFAGIAFALSHTSLSYRGLPLASSIAAIVLAIALLAFLKHRTEGLDLRSIGDSLVKTVIGSLALGLCCWVGAQLIPASSLHGETRNLIGLARLMAFGLVGIWVYYWVTKKLGMEESETLARAMRRFDRRRQRPSTPEG